MKVLIRTEASPTIGLGHILRMRVLAQWLRIYDVDCIFVLTDFENLTGNSAFYYSVHQMLAEMEFHVVYVAAAKPLIDVEQTLSFTRNIDLVVADSYGITQDWIRGIQSQGLPVALIDDHAELTRQADCLIDPTDFAARGKWLDSVPASAQLCGAEYFLASPQLLDLHFNVLARPFFPTELKSSRWTLSFGGTDVQYLLPKAIKLLSRHVDHTCHLDIAVNKHIAHRNEVLAALKKWPGTSNWVDGYDDVLTALSHAGMSLGAAGGMTFERALLGVPSVITQVADNQAAIFKGMNALDCCRCIPLSLFDDKGAFARLFNELDGQPDKIVQRRDNALLLSRGLGASWVVQYLTRTMHQDVYLRPASANFKQQLFVWQCSPGVRQFARNPSVPSWQEHERWYDQFRQNPGNIMAEVVFQQRSVGMIRLDCLQPADKIFEISILIDPNCQGRGVATMALKRVQQLLPNAILRAFIQPQNVASLSVFDKAGFRRGDEANWYLNEVKYDRSY